MKRGFTLIELLAVIVILAIIALIATPIVLDIIDDSKESANIQSINSLVDMAEMYATTNEATGNLYDKVIDKIKGTKPDNGTIYVNKKGEVALALKYNNKCYVKAYDSNKITQSKDENCIVPIDYLMVVDTTNNDDIAAFGGPIKRKEVERIITVSTNEVPGDVIGSFDVSENQNESIMAWYKDEDNNGLYELYIGQDGGVKANPDSTKLFNYYKNVISMDLSNMDTSNVNMMRAMFQSCEQLQTLNLSNFDTLNVINMQAMFNHCKSLQTLDLSSFDTSKVTTMKLMFQQLESLESLDLSSFDTSNVTDMSFMFSGLLVDHLDLSNLNTSNVVDMQFMFQGIKNIKTLDLSMFDTSKVTNMNHMFSFSTELQNLNLNNFITSNVVDMSTMFNNTPNLKIINMNKADFTKVTILEHMFNLSGVTSITVKDETAKAFIEARLTDASITGATVEIS